MMNTPKDVYKTIKRSISSTTNTLVFGNSSQISKTISNGTTAKRWIHPPG